MAKVTINGIVYEYDFSRQPLAEMLALEKALGTTYGQWSADRQAGSARALAGLAWMIWKRNGREVDFAKLESGEEPLDLGNFFVEDDDAGGEPDPTTSPGTTGASTPTGSSTSARSRKS